MGGIVKISIVIPTLKTPDELQSIKNEILLNTDRSQCELITTCQKATASVNRNAGLNQASGDIIIQCDDDIYGFFPGWVDALIKPFTFDPDTLVVSARLLRENLSPNYMNGDEDGSHINDGEYYEVPTKLVPGACTAMRKTDLRYDEGFKGSGFEDTDFTLNLRERFPNGRVFIANNCKLIHRNEMKNQVGANREIFNHNYAHCLSKHPGGW